MTCASARHLFLWLFALIFASAVEGQDTGRAVVPAGTRIFVDLAYVPNGHERQRLDLYVPNKGAAPFPVILWIHGGSWRTGGKDAHRVFPLVTSFIADGYAVASINHRYSQQEVFPAQIQDAKADEEAFSKRARSGELHLKIFITSASDEQYRGSDQQLLAADTSRMVDNASELADRLKKLNPSSITVSRTIFEGELHPTVPSASLSRALRFALARE